MYEFLNLCVYLFFVGTICWKLPSFIGKFRFNNTKRNNKEKDDCQCWNSEDNYWASQVIQQTLLQEPQEHLQLLQSLQKPQLLHLYQEQKHLQQPQQPQQNQEHQKLPSLQPKEPEKPHQSQTQQSQRPIPQRPIPFIQLIRQQPQQQPPQQSQQPIPFIQRISQQPQLQQPHQSQQPKHPQQSQQPIPQRPIPFIQLIRQQPQHQLPQQSQQPIPFIQRISQQHQPQQPIPQQPIPQQPIPQQPIPKQPIPQQPIPNQPIPQQPIPQQPTPQQPTPQQPIPFIQRIRQQPQPQQPQQPQQPISFIERICQQLQPQQIHSEPTQQPQTQNAPIKPNEIDLSLVNSNGRLSLDPTPLNETEKALIRLNERIELYQLMPKKEIPGDGNCQMHALSDQIFGDLEHSVIIRNNIVDWLRQNKGFYLPNGETLSDFVTTNSWEEYCNSMSQNGTWGDHLTLVAAAEIYKINISIISSVESQSSSFIEITPSIKCQNGILLSHFAEFHYGSLCPLAS
ncbi:hypothetical protein DICPUDRAFT_81296 [Dictyostelium purpureum]|uniref:OTU domain-containing protein n=1 Tax=Dictyostelium purpureum TaxID=5786 RepID=F0ZT25_DICPU|nr:uncharacterized protein DICPUDRAFT_81296 [Dictyostelium purpureum]EGC32921.1 hypothetical protein DICPUDRAFT_81296 [Dictyostelium purpureum]|eukprot:XP_003290569.1 hypothetical protein DICPUDRAFT_81296 [Dictyostelium purpureum]